jgi:hypothetical protein
MWIDLLERHARTAAVDPAAPFPRGAPLDQMTAVRHAAALDLHLNAAPAPIGDPPVHATAAVGPNPSLQAMSQIPMAAVHATNLRPTGRSCQP